jgi:hypothetical protein
MRGNSAEACKRSWQSELKLIIPVASTVARDVVWGLLLRNSTIPHVDACQYADLKRLELGCHG